MTLAIFDLDNTIVKGQSQLRLLLYLINKGKAKFIFVAPVIFWFVAYKLYLVKNPEKVMRYSFRIMTDTTPEKQDKLLRIFYDECLSKKINFKIIKRIEEHRKKGDRLVLLSNVLEPLALIVGEKLGFDDVIATKLKIVDGRYTGDIENYIVYGKNKVKALEEKYSAEEINNSFIYADHHSDLPLFKITSNPVVVNPDKKILFFALKNRWEIIRSAKIV